MRALFAWQWREALHVRTLSVVASAHVLLLLAFLLAWHDGLPLWRGTSLVDQQGLVQTTFLLVALPWAAARGAAPVSRSRLAGSAALLARQPATLILARVLASALVLAALVTAAVPVVVLATQMSALRTHGLTSRAMELMAMCGMAAASSTAWGVVSRDRLWTWLGAQASTCAVCVPALWWGGSWLPGVITLAGALATTAVAMSIANRTCLYVAA